MHCRDTAIEREKEVNKIPLKPSPTILITFRDNDGKTEDFTFLKCHSTEKKRYEKSKKFPNITLLSVALHTWKKGAHFFYSNHKHKSIENWTEYFDSFWLIFFFWNYKDNGGKIIQICLFNLLNMTPFSNRNVTMDAHWLQRKFAFYEIYFRVEHARRFLPMKKKETTKKLDQLNKHCFQFNDDDADAT